MSTIDEDWSKADSDALERAERELREVFGGGRLPLPVMRENLDSMMSALPLPADTTVTEVSVGGIDALEVATGPVDDGAVVVWFHGGGYVMGSAHGYRGVAAAVSAAAGCPVVVPDYRRAPESPFPAALFDASVVTEWAAQTYGSRWALAGDSAGGGLTMASLLRARDTAAPMPAAAVLVSPLADLTAAGESFDRFAATDVAISRPSVHGLAQAYAPGHDVRDPYVSPVFGTLERIPQTLILSSDSEALLDDAKTLHESMLRDGSPSTLSVYSGVCHAWPMFASYMPRARRAVEEIGVFLRPALAP